MARKAKSNSKMEKEIKDQVEEQVTVDETTPDTEKQEEKAVEPTPEEKLAALNDKHLRLFAEFENFKRRTAKERVELFKNAGERIVTEMITVIDDFERAISAAESETDVAKVKEGMSLIQSKFVGILAKEGLKAMDSSVGQDLDTDKHEAITIIPAPTDDLKGKIIDEVEKGYLLNDKVVRFAKVVMGQA